MSTTLRVEEAIAAAGEAFADALERLASRTPQEAARAAWQPGGPSVDVLEARIRAQRTQTARAAS